MASRSGRWPAKRLDLIGLGGVAPAWHGIGISVFAMGLEIRHGEPPIFGAHPRHRSAHCLPPASCPRPASGHPASAATTVARAGDSFSKGPIPFADFLYDLNRKHALEARAQKGIVSGPVLGPTDAASGGEESRGVAMGVTRGDEPRARSPIPPADQVVETARVLHVSRPVGRFIDLYV